jgi:large conductance mechanosensitive channel
MTILDEFKAFVLRGNVVDLAVAVVIGAAFGAVVTSLVENLFTPLIAAIIGEPDFSGLTFTINNSQFFYGAFINALLAFLMIALVVFLFVIKPLNTLTATRRKEVAADPTTRECPYCLSVIPIAATRCAHCTSELTATEG